MSDWRYIAQRALTGEILDLDVPLSRDELTWSLSGAGSLRGSVSPDTGLLRAADGELLLQEWGTLLYAEADGVIRWGGIVVSSSWADEVWSIEAAGFSTYPHGIAYTDVYSRVGVDPLDIVREVWRHVQAQTDGDLGVSVVAGHSPVRLGVAGIAAYEEVYVGGKWQKKSDVSASKIDPSATGNLKKSVTATSTSFELAKLGDFANVATPFNVTVGSETITVGTRSGTTLSGLTRGVGSSKPTAHDSGTKVTHTGTASRTVAAVPAEPFALTWWDAPDCGETIDSLAKETPFDYIERHTWSGDSISHEVVIGYPRMGTRRADLAFVQGDNVIDVVSPTATGDDYANVVLGIGAGEGAKALRRSIGTRDGRLRRMSVYTAKSTTRTAALDALIRAEITRRRNLLDISSITVRDHPNAPLGSWTLGDDVLVQATLPWLGEIDLWCRVTAWSLLSDDTATLSLARSDSFDYGGSST